MCPGDAALAVGSPGAASVTDSSSATIKDCPSPPEVHRPGRPCKTTVCSHFGNWRSALAAAGLADMDVSQRTNRLSRHI
jgi:hypothetical protein